MHECEGDLVCTATIEKVPYFNAPIFLENKSQIGKVDEIFGPMTEYVRKTEKGAITLKLKSRDSICSYFLLNCLKECKRNHLE